MNALLLIVLVLMSEAPPAVPTTEVLRPTDHLAWDDIRDRSGNRGGEQRFELQLRPTGVTNWSAPHVVTTNRVYAGIIFHGRTNGIYEVKVDDSEPLTVRWISNDNGKKAQRLRIEHPK